MKEVHMIQTENNVAVAAGRPAKDASGVALQNAIHKAISAKHKQDRKINELIKYLGIDEKIGYEGYRQFRRAMENKPLTQAGIDAIGGTIGIVPNTARRLHEMARDHVNDPDRGNPTIWGTIDGEPMTSGSPERTNPRTGDDRPRNDHLSEIDSGFHFGRHVRSGTAFGSTTGPHVGRMAESSVGLQRRHTAENGPRSIIRPEEPAGSTVGGTSGINQPRSSVLGTKSRTERDQFLRDATNLKRNAGCDELTEAEREYMDRVSHPHSGELDPPKVDRGFLDHGRAVLFDCMNKDPHGYRTTKILVKAEEKPNKMEWKEIDNWWFWIAECGRYIAEVCYFEERPNEAMRRALWKLLCPATQAHLQHIFSNAEALEQTVDWVVEQCDVYLRQMMGNVEIWLATAKRKNGEGFNAFSQRIFAKISRLTVGFRELPVLQQNHRMREIQLKYMTRKQKEQFVAEPDKYWWDVATAIDRLDAIRGTDGLGTDYARNTATKEKTTTPETIEKLVDQIRQVIETPAVAGPAPTVGRPTYVANLTNRRGDRHCYVCGKDGHHMFKCDADPKTLSPEKVAKLRRAQSRHADTNRRMKDKVAALDDQEDSEAGPVDSDEEEDEACYAIQEEMRQEDARADKTSEN
jgi:hypothetical protein